MSIFTITWLTPSHSLFFIKQYWYRFRYKSYFDTIEKFPLTVKQRQSVIVDEQRNLVIAGAGTSVLADVFQGGFIPSEPSESFQGTLYQFLVSKFVPEVRQLHIECGYVPKESDGFEFLIGYKTELFYLASDYSLLRNNDTFYGIGSGYAYGIGALAAGANIKEAMKIATKFDINTGGTIQIVKRGELNA